MRNLDQDLAKKLDRRKELGNYRELRIGGQEIDFVSNDYLGLSRNSELRRIIQEAVDKMPGGVNGSTGSRLLSGNHEYSQELEVFLADFFNADTALVFGAGYLANLALLSSVPQKGDTVLYDELSHACIKDGVRLSLAHRYSFPHNDLNDLKNKLDRAEGKKFVVVESVYSMDGDRAPLEQMDEICKNYGATLIVDEAHSTGLYGDHGEGLGDSDSMIRIMTFGKGVGAHGACILGSAVLRNYLINFARPFIYTTAAPIHSLVAIRKGLEYIAGHPEIRQDLDENIEYFLQKTEDIRDGDNRNLSPIQAIMVPGNERVKKLCNELNSEGLDVRPILHPTVKEGEERIRICLHSYNRKDEIDLLIDKLKQHLK